ncbi:MAG: hypothetical protein QOF56_1361, partial [Acidobacteriaceae bacterium]|nr:hypothetical protein [Acidobacteriaceae bacterium]
MKRTSKIDGIELFYSDAGDQSESFLNSNPLRHRTN